MILGDRVPVRRRADILVFDAEDQPVVLVEVKARQLGDEKPALEQLASYLTAMPPTVRYAMLVDLAEMRVYNRQPDGLSESLARFPTADVLSEYEPNFSAKPIFDYYLVGLVEAWLRDIAYHWKNEAPPQFAAMRRIGVAQQIAGGTTRSEIPLA